MKSQHDICAQVDSKGRLILPKEIACRYGLNPGDTLPLIEGLHDFTLRQPVSLLKKAYIEPTNGKPIYALSRTKKTAHTRRY